MSIIMSTQPLPNPPPSPPPPGNPPVVTPKSITLPLLVTTGQNVGTPVVATNSPTSWQITNSPFGYTDMFTIDSSGQIHVGAHIDIAPQSYSLTVQAGNAYGTGNATITVNATTTGTIYYVSPTGSDSNNGTSASTPFQTADHVITMTTHPGDCAMFMAGTYTPGGQLNFTSSGTAAHPIMWFNYHNQNVTLDAASAAGLSNTAFIQVAANYVYISGFNITTSVISSNNANGFGTYGGSNNKISYCNVSNFWDTGISISVNGGPSGSDTNNWVDRCIAHDNSQINANRALNGAGGWGAGIAIWSVNSKLTNSTSYHNWGEGIGFYDTSGGLMTGNTTYDNYNVLLYCTASESCVMDGNLIYSTGDFQWGNSGTSPPDGLVFSREDTSHIVQNNKAINNIIIGPWVGLHYANFGAAGGMINCILSCNTVVNCNAYSFAINTDPNHSGNTAQNNIFYGAPAAGVTNGWTTNHNDWFNSDPGPYSGTGDITSDPSFVVAPGSFVGAEYQLNAGSPCRGAGANLHSTITDDFGTVGSSTGRPNSAFTMGAWE